MDKVYMVWNKNELPKLKRLQDKYIKESGIPIKRPTLAYLDKIEDDGIFVFIKEGRGFRRAFYTEYKEVK